MIGLLFLLKTCFLIRAASQHEIVDCRAVEQGTEEKDLRFIIVWMTDIKPYKVPQESRFA